MKHRTIVTAHLLFACAALSVAATTARASSTLDFNELSPSTTYYSYDEANDEDVAMGKYTKTTSFSSGVATFSNTYTASWGSWYGWAYSTTYDTATSGYLNQFSAYSGSNDGTYLVAYDPTLDGSIYGYGEVPKVFLEEGYRPLSLDITNTTYAALSMLNGDGFAKKFGGSTGNDADWFLLTITGYNSLGESTGTVEFYLADYRFSDNSQDYLVDDWTTVDLSSLGDDTTELDFSFSSSDAGDYGMNTPAYAAVDNLVVEAVPEPSTIAFMVLGGAFLAAARQRHSARRNRKRV